MKNFTVEQLIEELKKQDPKLFVCIHNPYYDETIIVDNVTVEETEYTDSDGDTQSKTNVVLIS